MAEEKKPGRKKKTAESKDTQEVKTPAEAKKRGRKSKEKTEEKSGVGGNGNLIPFDQLTEEEQREIRSKGGKASVIARKRKKELREFTRDFLMQESNPALKNNMATLGVDADQMTNLAAMVARLFSKAVNQGDLNAARTIIEWAGMAPLQQERENEAIAKMSQVMQLASGNNTPEEDGSEDVVFYIPDNGRAVVIETET